MEEIVEKKEDISAISGYKSVTNLLTVQPFLIC